LSKRRKRPKKRQGALTAEVRKAPFAGPIAEPIQIFEPLSAMLYRQRFESIIPSIYLTFVSIIEGVALGLLAQQMFTFSPNNGNHFGALVGRAPYALSTLLSMVIVTYEYIVLTLIHRYSYQLLDVVILFMLGLSQIGPIFFLNDPIGWWAGNICFCGVGAVAFVNESYRNKPAAFGVSEIYRMIVVKLRFDIFVALLATVWSGFGVFLLLGNNRGEPNTILRTILVSRPMQAIVDFTSGWRSPWMLLLPMIVIQLGILIYEDMHLRRIQKKLGLVW
jgi:hypothetical protein